MPDATFTRSNFLGGEISQAAQGRIDKPEYLTALNRCVNAMLWDTGAWTRRPGFQFGGTTRNGNPARVIPFAFKQNQPYNMEFTDGFIRYWRGPTLAKTNDAQTVSTISSANPAKVAATLPHGWSSGYQGMFGNLAGSTPMLLNRQFIITVTSSTEFTIADAITGAGIDGSTLGANPAAATFSRIMETAAPYTAQAWQSLRSVQTETASVLLNGTAPQVLNVTAQPSDTTSATFALTPASFVDGPYYDPPTNGTLITPDAKTGLINLALSYPAYSATKAYSIGDLVTSSSVDYVSLIGQNVNNTPASTIGTAWAIVQPGVTTGTVLFSGSDIGRAIRLFSEPGLWAVGTPYALAAVVKYNNAYWTALVGSNIGNQPGIDITKWGVATTAAIWSWGKITGLRNIIDRALSGSVNIGTLIGGGGLAAAFDGNLSQTAAAAANHALSSAAVSDSYYVGKNYSGAAAQAIQAATIFPPSDQPFISAFMTVAGAGQIDAIMSVTFNLRGKASAPASSTDGTLLGSSGAMTINRFDTSPPITVVSNDQVTTWNYLWFEIAYTITNGPTGVSPNATGKIAVSEVEFFKPVVGSGSGITIQLIGSDLLYTTAITTWRLGLFSGSTGYPTCGTYHERRIWLSGIIGNRVDASVPLDSSSLLNSTINFAPTEVDGTVTDSSAIDYTFTAKDVNSILWMESDQQGIICGTAAGEWLIQGPATGITPTAIGAHRYTSIGCANVEPRHTGLTYTFVQKFKHKLMEYFADVFSGRFTAPNLSQNAKHLATRGIEEIAYQQELSPVIWNRCTDGSLIGATYKRESLSSSQGPSFIGWHQHALGSGRTIESLCVGPSVDGLLDTLCIVSNDSSNVRHVEFLTNMFEEGSAISTAWFLDDAVSAANTVATVAGVPSLVCTGLWHLNGKTVTVSAGGIDCGDFAVSSGQAVVPLAGLLTQAYISSFTTFPVVVGFTYTSDGQIVRPVAPQETGARNGPAMGKIRREEWFAALLVDTQGISIGTDFADLDPMLFESDGGTIYTNLQLFNGVWRDNLEDDYSFDSMLCWRVTRPYPATVANISGFIATQDA